MAEISEKAVEAAHAAYWSTDDGPSGNDRPAMRAALTAALPHLMGWQPIETAPRDGETVITCILEPGALYPVCVTVNHYNDPSRVARGYGLGSKGWWASKPGQQPTHWMPLPPAPTNQERGNG